MNQGLRRFVSSFVLGLFLIAACQSEPAELLPVTGSSNKSTVPARVSLAQGKVLEYVLAFRLTDIPTYADWQMQEIQDDSEYSFRSGDWQMIIWTSKDDTEYQRIVIVNRVENLSWTGYITPEGRVVDTAYAR